MPESLWAADLQGAARGEGGLDVSWSSDASLDAVELGLLGSRRCGHLAAPQCPALALGTRSGTGANHWSSALGLSTTKALPIACSGWLRSWARAQGSRVNVNPVLTHLY